MRVLEAAQPNRSSNCQIDKLFQNDNSLTIATRVIEENAYIIFEEIRPLIYCLKLDV